MIRINLLPVRAARKKESIRFQTTIAVLITSFCFILAIFLYVVYVFEVQSIKEEINIVAVENAKIMKKIGQLKNIKAEKKLVQDKLDVVDELEAGRSGPVELLTKIANAIPEMATLSSLVQKENIITVRGYAADKEVVASFMRNLRSAGTGWRAELGQMTAGKTGKRSSVSFDLRITAGPKHIIGKGKKGKKR